MFAHPENKYVMLLTKSIGNIGSDVMLHHYIDGVLQERRNYIALADY